MSKVAGHANVLVFPDINSGNIASKLVQHVARANAYGQILLGLDRPAADVSRGSNAHDILGVGAIVGMQGIAYSQLYPAAEERTPGEDRRRNTSSSLGSWTPHAGTTTSPQNRPGW